MSGKKRYCKQNTTSSLYDKITKRLHRSEFLPSRRRFLFSQRSIRSDHGTADSVQMGFLQFKYQPSRGTFQTIHMQRRGNFITEEFL